MSPRRVDRDEAWFARLRERFVEIASGRVEPDVVEDLVQDALRIVHEKAAATPGNLVDGRPVLAWCFQILRNVIGNHYQKRLGKTQVPVEESRLTAAAPTPLESLERDQMIGMLHRALRELERSAGQCAEYLRRVVAGDSPAAIAATESVESSVIYRRLYRCRELLRDILYGMGGRP